MNIIFKDITLVKRHVLLDKFAELFCESISGLHIGHTFWTDVALNLVLSKYTTARLALFSSSVLAIQLEKCMLSQGA
jgi:hypothetical protein